MKTISILVMSSLTAVALSPAAQAFQDVTSREVRDGKVTACSSYGSTCYTAALVRSPLGWKMRLKHGTVIDCRGDCRDTLRRETVDFWYDQRERSR